MNTKFKIICAVIIRFMMVSAVYFFTYTNTIGWQNTYILFVITTLGTFSGSCVDTFFAVGKTTTMPQFIKTIIFTSFINLLMLCFAFLITDKNDTGWYTTFIFFAAPILATFADSFIRYLDVIATRRTDEKKENNETDKTSNSEESESKKINYIRYKKIVKWIFIIVVSLLVAILVFGLLDEFILSWHKR